MRVPTHEAEVARARFLELAPEGFEEAEHDGELELAAYTDVQGEDRIRAVFGSARATPVDPRWEERWRDFHRGVIAGGLWLGPPWEKPQAGNRTVVVEPGRAFGTGAHATTRACVELLARSGRGSLLDAGCGSGVLAIAALRLGYDPVVALDVDETAVEVARENALRNAVDLDVRVGTVLRGSLPTADVLVANIELRTVESLLGRWTGIRAVTSGYLADEQPRAFGWSSEERLELDGWAADRFVRTA